MICLSRGTCESAWLAAARAMQTSDNREAHNLVVEIERPALHSSCDLAMRQEVDGFLRLHNANPLFTVAETIFPAGLYLTEGVKGVFETYLALYDDIKQPHEWGRYAERMLRRRDKNGKEYNPLSLTLDRLRTAVGGRDRKRAIYELPCDEDAFDLPILRADRRTRGGPCLSHISLKLGRTDTLFLTAVYRYHYFVERALGNYLGLAALQAFLCDQAKLSPGPLVCVSTFAKLDSEGDWNDKKVDSLLDDCAGLLEPRAEA